MRNSGSGLIGLYILTFLIIGLSNGSFKASKQSSRLPASVVGSCFHDVRLFFSKRATLTKAWSKFKKAKSGHKLDFERIDFYREEYLRGIETDGLQFRDVHPSSEGLIAYIEAINKNFGGDHIPEMKKMDYFRRKKVASIVDTLNADGKVLFKDIENLMGELYLAVYGPSMKANEVLFEDNIEKRVLARVIQEDLASRGLTNVFVKYRILGKKKTWAQKFVRSNLGKTLGASVMNLGSVFGLPPIYLPNLRPLKIPDHLVQELLENGLNKEITKKLEQEIGRNLGDRLTFNLQNRARYRLFRRYYMAGISAYLTYMMIMEFHETNSSLSEEAELIEAMASEMTSNLENAMELEAKGYDIFEKSEEEKEETVLEKNNRWCSAITECLQSESEDLGEKVVKGSDTYKACKEFMDPQNLCPSL
ncbi:MAG: hypothetical protein ACJAT2_000421 [Bacteriovoracaceae bacterium]